MTFLERFRKKNSEKNNKTSEWHQITLENCDAVGDGQKKLDKATMAVLSGKINPLESQGLLAEFMAQGWEVISPQIKPLVFGKSYAAPWVLGEIFEKFPGESADAFLQSYEQLPLKNGFMLLSAVGEGREAEITDILAKVIPNLDAQDLAGALELLGKFPTASGNEILASFLHHEEWSVVMKAATGLENAKAVEYLPQIKVAAAQGGILEKGLTEIMKRMA